MQIRISYETVSKLTMRIFIFEIIFANILYAKTLPTVQPGLFVISGVVTCGEGTGYCLMGNDCTVNEDFQADSYGHCSGLRTAFIPETHFSCCRYAVDNSTFDELNAAQPPTSTPEDDINQTVTSAPDTADSSWPQNAVEVNDPRQQTRIQDEIDENRMSRTQLQDGRRAPANASPRSHESRSQNNSSSAADVEEALCDSSCANDQLEDVSAITTTTTTTTTTTSTDDGSQLLNFPHTALIDGGDNYDERTLDVERDSTRSLRTEFDDSKESDDRTHRSNGVANDDDDRSRASNSEEAGDERQAGGGGGSGGGQTRRTSRVRDLSGALSAQRERKIDINHLGCADDVHTDSDDSRAYEGAPNTVRANRVDEGAPPPLAGRATAYANDVDDHTHARSPVQWFHMARSIIADIETTLANATNERPPVERLGTSGATRDLIDHYFLGKLAIPDELRGNAFAANDQFRAEKCLNFAHVDDDAPKCVSVWKFVANGDVVCFGTLLNSIWLLTSASCITKIYDNRMDTVVVTDVEEKNGVFGISNMIVNENYRAEEQHELNDIGLVSLDRVSNSSCFVCLSKEEKKYADKTCSTYVMTASKNNEDSLNNCQGRVKVLNMHSKLYLSLLCPTDENLIQKTHNSTSNALWCENVLVGIETTYDNGLFVFTSAYEYADWIQQNIQLYL